MNGRLYFVTTTLLAIVLFTLIIAVIELFKFEEKKQEKNAKELAEIYEQKQQLIYKLDQLEILLKEMK